MGFTRFLQRYFGNSKRPARRRAPQRGRLRLEELENRWLPSVSFLAGSVEGQMVSSFQDPTGKDVLIPLRGTDSDPNASVTYTVSSDNTNVTADILPSDDVVKMNVSGVTVGNVPFSGDLTLQLFRNFVPNSVDQIENLVNSGFFNNTSFYRVIDKFVAQGGNPSATNPNFNDEFSTSLTYTSQGLLGLANNGNDTVKTDFFITDIKLGFNGPDATFPQHLNFVNPIVGQLTSGFGIFSQLITTPPTSTGSETPANAPKINSVEMITDDLNTVLHVHANRGFTGNATVTVTATDDNGDTSTQQLTINVTPDQEFDPNTQSVQPINDRPFLNDATVRDLNTPEGTPVTFTLAGTDIDPGDNLQFTVRDTSFNTPSNVNVTVNGSQVTLTPKSGTAGQKISLLAGVWDGVTRSGTPAKDFNTQAFTLTVGTPSDQVISLDTGSDTGNAGDNFTSDREPLIHVHTTAGQTVDVFSNGTFAGTAVESAIGGQYTFQFPAGTMAVGDNAITARVHGTGTDLGSLTVTYAPSYQNLFVVPGSGTSQAITFNLTSREASFPDEVGVYEVDDLHGTVNGFAPGLPGYAQAVFASPTRHVLFGGSAGTSQTFTFRPGTLLGFYLVQGETLQQALAANPGDVRADQNEVFFSFKLANPDRIIHAQTHADDVAGSAQYAWEDMTGGGDKDFNDLVFEVLTPTAAPVDPVFRVAAGATQSVTLTATLNAATKALSGPKALTKSTNAGGELGFFRVDDPTGKIGSLLPGDVGWVQAALGSSNSHQSFFASTDTPGKTATASLTGDSLFGVYYVPGDTLDNLLKNNPTNDPAKTPTARFSFSAANPDKGVVHFRTVGPEGVSQDLPGTTPSTTIHVMTPLFGGLGDFDDASFTLT